MNLTEFCTNITSYDFSKNSVLLVRCKEYSPLFLQKYLHLLHQHLDIELKKIDLDQDLDTIYRSLGTTFLGQRYLYWFVDTASISSKKKRADWLIFLSTYQGPHYIVGLSTEELEKTLQFGQCIEVVEKYSSDQVTKLSLLYDKQNPETTAYFIGKLYRYRKEYSIEQLCILLEYAPLLGKNTELFFEQWLNQLVISDISLYYVSQLFFEKNSKDFFDVWSECRTLYSDQFWTSFFSEQLFKAYWYVAWQAKVSPESKMITYGLPFSFLKQDWKLYQLSTLQTAHQKIYEIDILLKSGGTAFRLDLFFIQFFKGF